MSNQITAEERKDAWQQSNLKVPPRGLSVGLSQPAVMARSLPDVKWAGELTNSARSTFLHCPKKFEYTYLRRLSPRTPSIPFLVGGLVHNGLERIYKTWQFDEQAERDIAEEACDKVCRDASATEAQSDMIWEQQAIVMGILRGYAKHYMAKDKKEWTVIEAESSFNYPLPAANILALKGPVRRTDSARGKRDLVVRRKKDGAVGLVEHKTTAQLSAGYIAKLPLDNQILGYANSMKKEFGKLPGFVTYNVAKKSGLRRKQMESFRDFTKRIESEYLGSPTMYFYRETLSFTERDVTRYEEELKRFTFMLDRSIKENSFYQNTGHCTALGRCPYMPLCIEGPNSLNVSRYQVRDNVHAELDDATVLE